MGVRVVLLAVAVLASGYSNPGRAQVLPDYDIGLHCQDISASSGSSPSLYESCVRAERSARDALKFIWPLFPSTLRDYCEDVAEAAGESYVVLNGCIKREMGTQPTGG